MDRIEIAIDSPQGGVYPVRITTGAGEQATATLTVPQVDADGEAMLTKLAYRDQQTSFSEDEVIALGQWLYGLLFQGATAGLFQSATSQAAIAKRPLQIQLHVASHPDLVPVAALPWEFLTDPQGHPLVTRYSLVRSLPHTSPISPLTVDGPLTMLLAWALPAELANDYPLNIEAEVQAIQTQLQPLIDAQQITLHILPHTTPLSLNRAIQDHQPHLLHLLGHGQAATSGAPQLVLETEEGKTQVVSPRTLSVALQGSEVRLIVLNACHSGAQGTQLFQAFGPAFVASGIPAVVGIQASVLDRAGRIFATELYRTLVKTGSVDQAVQQGRKALILTDVSQVDWGLATLYLRARNGLLFGKPSGDTPPQSPPSASGGTVFNQQGQQVGTQYNAGGNMTVRHRGHTSRSPLHQLRAPLGDFLGREIERKQVGLALTNRMQHTSPMCSIRGMGGIGKTELALLVAHDVAGSYPDGQLFISMAGNSETPRSAEDGLREIVQHFHASQWPLPISLYEMENLYRGYLSGKNVLIILDDVLDTATARSFIPPTGSALLITSRHTIALDGQATRLALDTLGNDAHNLVVRLAPRLAHDPQLDALLQRCGRLPLALRVAGQTLADREMLSIKEYLIRLTGVNTRFTGFSHDDRNVYTILAFSDDLLLREDAVLSLRWRMLHVCQGPFETKLAGILWDTHDQVRIEDALATLCQRSLLRYDSTTKSYILHDLLADIGHHRCSAAVRFTVAERYAQHFFTLLQETQQLYDKGMTSLIEGLHLFDTNKVHIMAGQRLTAQAPRSIRLRDLCIEYALYASDILSLRLHPVQWIEWLEAARIAATSARCEWHVHEVILANFGRAYSSLGQSAQARDYHLQELALIRQHGALEREPGTLINLGNSYFALGSLREAEQCFETALHEAQAHNDLATKGRALANLGRIAIQQGKLHHARDLHHQHLKITRALHDIRGEGAALSNLSLAHTLLGDYAEAKSYNVQAQILIQRLGDKHAEAELLSSLGMIYRHTGYLDQAIDTHQRALSLFQQTGDISREAGTLGSLGVNYLELGDIEKALEYQSQHLSIVSRLGDVGSQAIALINLGLVYDAQNEIRDAIRLYEEGIILARREGTRLLEASFLSLLAISHTELDDTSIASSLFEESLTILQNLGDNRIQAYTLWNFGIMCAKQHRYIEAVTHMKPLITYLETINHPDIAHYRQTLHDIQK